MRRTIGAMLVTLVLSVLPQVGWAQFGGLVKKSTYDTKPANQLIADMEAVVAEAEVGTLHVWTATETVQNLVKQYAEGDFPALTATWGEIRKSLTEAKDEAQKAAAIELSAKYLVEMAERKKAMETVLADPARSVDIKGKLQAPEKEQLAKISANLKPVPEKDTALITRATDLAAKAAKITAELGVQTAKDPLKAGDYKKLIDKLNALNGEVGKLPAELQKQVDSITTMMANITKLIAD